MTEKMIESRIKKLSALEEQIAQLQEQAETIKSELKADLEEKGLDELKTKFFLKKTLIGCTIRTHWNGLSYPTKRKEILSIPFIQFLIMDMRKAIGRQWLK